eukprot:COSAG01_NODE_724_length_14056_cov_41.795443_4_plen_76_part_00
MTEIHLCNVCSCQEVLRRNGRGQLSPGFEVWRGYHQSMHSCQGGLMLNLDVAAAAFVCAAGLHLSARPRSAELYL